MIVTNQITKRRLEMNWFNENTDLHKIVLYDADPTLVEEAKELIVLDAAFHKDRFFLTDIQLDKPTSEELGWVSVWPNLSFYWSLGDFLKLVATFVRRICPHYWAIFEKVILLVKVFLATLKDIGRLFTPASWSPWWEYQPSMVKLFGSNFFSKLRTSALSNPFVAENLFWISIRFGGFNVNSQTSTWLFSH